MRVCQLKVITSIDHRDRTLQDFYADLEYQRPAPLKHSPISRLDKGVEL